MLFRSVSQSRYGRQNALTEVGNDTGKAIEKATKKTEKGTEQSRSMKPQDKTGAYGEKRKPGDYLK